MPRVFPALYAAVVALLLPLAAGATTYSVGAGGACTHFSFHDALQAAVADPNGPHLIKLGSASPYIMNQYEIADPLADITIEGGYANCSAAAPTQGAVSTLQANADNRLLYMHNANTNPRRKVTLSHLKLIDGNSPGIGITYAGGAVLATGNLALEVRRSSFEGNQAGDGGAIAIFNLTSDDSKRTALYLGDDSDFWFNEAVGVVNHTGNGGAVYALGSVRIDLDHVDFSRNIARRAGGAIALDGDARLLALAHGDDPDSSYVASFSSNQASTATFSSTEGLGGAIYARSSTLGFRSLSTDSRFAVYLGDNRANYGGAIYATSDSATVHVLALDNAWFNNNHAAAKGGALYSAGGIEWQLDSRADAPCQAYAANWSCSLMLGNTADNMSTPATPGGGAFYMAALEGAPVGTAFFQRTWFENNADNHGTAAVGNAETGAQVTLERSILRNNAAAGTSSVVLRTAGATRVHYSSVLDNATTRLFGVTNAVLDAQGSIFAAPGKPVWYHVGSATMKHNDCLLSHTGDDIPGGVLIGDAQLDPNLAPVPRSQALDACDNLDYAAPPDMFQRAPTNAAGWDDFWGINDLGAIEQTDIIFYGGFGTRLSD